MAEALRVPPALVLAPGDAGADSPERSGIGTGGPCASRRGYPGTAQTWATKTWVAAVGQALDHDWDRMVTFYQFPQAHWKYLSR
jgi:hypothetical protein